MKNFELGPIRPPSEAESILLRITRNCPWNKCAFCPVYKNEKFSPRSVEEIKADIDAMHYIAEKIKEKSHELGYKGYVNDYVISKIHDIDASQNNIRQIAFWLYYGMKSLFLQDADSLVIKTDRLVEVLNYIREKFPTIERITSYSRAKTVSKKSPEELKSLRNAGLNRIHIGMESGSDKVLDLICKGVTQSEQIIAGKNAIEAGFELSEYYMPGVGGKEFTLENALESAKVVNEINPTFIRIRSAIPVPGTPLYQYMIDKKWTPLTEEEKVKEIKLFFENLTGITSIIKSDHIMNLIEDAEGVLPDDRDAILRPINKFLDMDKDDKESFIIGRRIGRFRYISDYQKNPEIEEIKMNIKAKFSSIDEGILEILRNFI